MNVRELKQKRAGLIGQARAIIDKAHSESRDLSEDEQKQYDGFMAQVDKLQADIERLEKLEAAEAGLGQVDPRRTPANPGGGAPAHLKTGLGDNYVKATAHYIRTGDARALGGVKTFAQTVEAEGFAPQFMAASNDTDMNIGTAADGGNAVPTGHYQGIIAKRDELALFGPLGVTDIPGVGTTVNVPYDNGIANIFVAPGEAQARDRDAPALGSVAMTLALYTKKVQLSLELLRDEDSKLLAFLEDYVGRAAARTHNSLFITEVLANGTSVALGAAAAVSVGDPETLWGNLKEAYGDGSAFITRRATEAALRKLVSTSAFLYAQTPDGARTQRVLSGYPIHNSEFLAAIGAGNKSIAFGNFAYVGKREPGGMGFLRDPYGAANTGQVNLYYYMSVIYKVLVAEAVLYGTHPTA